MKQLREVQLDYALKSTLSQWRREDDLICRALEFDEYITAGGRMSKVALIAEKEDHHPNWCNVYNRVSIKLSTHDAFGLTEKDLRLAAAIDHCLR